jgi:hypothetical protein
VAENSLAILRRELLVSQSGKNLPKEDSASSAGVVVPGKPVLAG